MASIRPLLIAAVVAVVVLAVTVDARATAKQDRARPEADVEDRSLKDALSKLKSKVTSALSKVAGKISGVSGQAETKLEQISSIGSGNNNKGPSASPPSTAANDDTLKAKVHGPAVVETICTRLEASCVFPDDKLFLRRLAFVESNDGMKKDTFRDGYYGGIWQVDEDKFEKTQSTISTVVLQPYIHNIKTSFGIDWATVEWKDLTRPLYSALAARLYVQYRLAAARLDEIPRDVDEQAKFWQDNYRSGGHKADFSGPANNLEKECVGVGVDLMFAIDGSGSIGNKNFRRVKKFIKSVVSSFDIGPKETQVGLIKFSSKVHSEFDLNTYSSKNAVLAAVDRVTYTAGGTNTHLALDQLTTVSFTEEHGARPLKAGHPRVAVVLTDGKSNSPAKTVVSALKTHSADITVIAVGVGKGVDVEELEVIASDPICLHLTLLKSFTEIDALKSAIRRRSCTAPIIFSPVAENITRTTTLPAGTTVNCKLMVPQNGMTVFLSTVGGQGSFYVSRSTYPSSSFYDDKLIAVSRHQRSALYVAQPSTADQEGLVFCSIEGDPHADITVNISIYCGKNECKKKPCQNGGTCVDLKRGYRCECPDGYSGKNCETEIDNCSPGICNHGTCTSMPGGYVCSCDEGYAGSDCSVVVDPCDPNPCDKGACSAGQDGAYVCDCYAGYTGDTCDVDIDECTSDPCVNGECNDLVDGFDCQCKPGYTGDLCDTEIDECTSNPCVNGDCVDKLNGYTCNCLPGYTGDDCSSEIDECESNPCVAGTCVDIVDGYKCTCSPGFTGQNCELPIDACSSSPCQNGECKPLENGFECCCDAGYEGKYCETDVDECSSNPCVRGECVDGSNYYQCVCPPGYTGVHCEIDIDECKSDPCLNGDCTDLVNG